MKIENPMLKMVGAEADRLGLECYVIGGYVRDLFLHRESTDIDVVVVGSGISLAEAVAKKLGKGAHLSVFKTYGTAQVKRGDLELEFVGARRESYTRDSRNPIVEDGTLQEDQDRRDFQPVIQAAGKIATKPAVVETNIESSQVHYSDFTAEVTPQATFNPLLSQPTRFEAGRKYNGYIRGALGHPNTLLDFGYHLDEPHFLLLAERGSGDCTPAESQPHSCRRDSF